jgi:hypothetical protein
VEAPSRATMRRKEIKRVSGITLVGRGGGITLIRTLAKGNVSRACGEGVSGAPQVGQ